jgi:hypothetical protein
MVQFVYYDSYYILEIMLLKILQHSSNGFIYFGNYVAEINVSCISTWVQFVYYDSYSLFFNCVAIFMTTI